MSAMWPLGGGQAQLSKRCKTAHCLRRGHHPLPLQLAPTERCSIATKTPRGLRLGADAALGCSEPRSQDIAALKRKAEPPLEAHKSPALAFLPSSQTCNHPQQGVSVAVVIPKGVASWSCVLGCHISRSAVPMQKKSLDARQELSDLKMRHSCASGAPDVHQLHAPHSA